MHMEEFTVILEGEFVISTIHSHLSCNIDRFHTLCYRGTV